MQDNLKFCVSAQLVDAIKVDALAPYVVMAWEAMPSLLGSDPDIITPIETVLVRHISLLNRLNVDHGYPYLQRPFSQLVRLAKKRIASDEQSPNPLVRYLARRRSELAEPVVQEGGNGIELANRTWHEIRSDESLSRAFDVHMINRSAHTLRFEVDAGANPILVDIGGGPGQYAVAALQRLPDYWTAIVVDAYAKTGWFADREASKLRDRIGKLITNGSWSFPGEAGVYLIASILHNLSDHEAARLLRICAEKSKTTTRVIVIERSWDPENLRDSSRDLDMHLLFGGRERTDEEIGNMLKATGMTLVSHTVIDGYRLLAGRVKGYANG